VNAPAPEREPAQRFVRLLAYIAFAFALFACVWATRVFIAAPLAALVIPLESLGAIALVAVLGGLLPALVLGSAYGLVVARPVVRKAFAVAAGASVLELGLASATVEWWAFLTWWVLPLECVSLLLSFPAAAWISSRLAAPMPQATRRGCGIAIYALATTGAVAWPWLPLR
jgi:hypothetical protein